MWTAIIKSVAPGIGSLNVVVTISDGSISYDFPMVLPVGLTKVQAKAVLKTQLQMIADSLDYWKAAQPFVGEVVTL